MFIRPSLLLSVLALSIISPALASIALYGQCGGDGLPWPDTCAEGLTCQYLNFWYSQCLTAPPPTVSTATATDIASSTSTGTPDSGTLS
ncbi:hypothetical protein B0H11DRAFT_859275 [Mycena galericulata]|nr:hypothetical protein B0H11DRAFT_859275 [Mycena galericulata]